MDISLWGPHSIRYRNQAVEWSRGTRRTTQPLKWTNWAPIPAPHPWALLPPAFRTAAQRGQLEGH